MGWLDRLHTADRRRQEYMDGNVGDESPSSQVKGIAMFESGGFGCMRRGRRS